MLDGTVAYINGEFKEWREENGVIGLYPLPYTDPRLDAIMENVEALSEYYSGLPAELKDDAEDPVFSCENCVSNPKVAETTMYSHICCFACKDNNLWSSVEEHRLRLVETLLSPLLPKKKRGV